MVRPLLYKCRLGKQTGRSDDVQQCGSSRCEIHNPKMLKEQSASREGAEGWIIIGPINAEAEIITTMLQEPGAVSVTIA